jgi:hypothetical protein
MDGLSNPRNGPSRYRHGTERRQASRRPPSAPGESRGSRNPCQASMRRYLNRYDGTEFFFVSGFVLGSL